MTIRIPEPRGSKPIAEFQALIGSVVGISDWFSIGQERIDGFADVTEDHQYIHVDPALAASSVFGGTIAHGFLSLSMLSRMAELALPAVEGTSTTINYGFDRIRFLAPVASGGRIRALFALRSVTPRPGGQTLFLYEVTVEIDGSSRPALSAEWLILTLSENTETTK